jgi:sec-independent protein translocase protein TatA
MLAFFLGHTEIIVILIIALLLFGTRLPKVARSLGQGIKEFKGGLRDVKGEVDKAGDEAPPKTE